MSVPQEKNNDTCECNRELDNDNSLSNDRNDCEIFSQNQILKIHNKHLGDLIKTFSISDSCNDNYKKVLISGNMNDFDVNVISIRIYTQSSFRSIDLSCANIKVIPHQAFCFKYCLEEFICPVSLETIGSSCFLFCKRLKKFVIFENLKEIKNGSFNGCRELELVVPEGVKVSIYAFDGCPKVDTSKCKIIQESRVLYQEEEEEPEREGILMKLFKWVKGLFESFF